MLSQQVLECGSQSDREPAWQLFHDLMDLIVPDGSNVALLSAYFDASEMESGVFSVGGFAFGWTARRKPAAIGIRYGVIPSAIWQILIAESPDRHLETGPVSKLRVG